MLLWRNRGFIRQSNRERTERLRFRLADFGHVNLKSNSGFTGKRLARPNPELLVKTCTQNRLFGEITRSGAKRCECSFWRARERAAGVRWSNREHVPSACDWRLTKPYISTGGWLNPIMHCRRQKSADDGLRQVSTLHRIERGAQWRE